MFVKFQSHLMDISTHSSSQYQNIVKNKQFPINDGMKLLTVSYDVYGGAHLADNLLLPL